MLKFTRRIYIISKYANLNYFINQFYYSNTISVSIRLIILSLLRFYGINS